MATVSAAVRFEGIPQLRQALRRVRQRYAKGVERGQRKAAEFLLAESRKLVPVETGELKRSSHVTQEGSGFSSVAHVVYNAPYAIYVHENLEANHAPPTQAKYLEAPARRHRGQMSAIIRREAGLR